MSYVTVEELQLLSFFEVEPSRLDRDIPWPYNGFSYQLEVGPYSVHFSIYPAYKELSLSVSRDGAEVYKLQTMSVKDVVYHKDGEVETLQIVVSDRDNIWFRLRPTLLITQDVGEA